MNVKATLERGGQRVKVLFRQAPHDERLVVGAKIRWGSGAKWRVVLIEPMEAA